MQPFSVLSPLVVVLACYSAATWAKTEFYSARFPVGEVGASAEQVIRVQQTLTFAVTLRFHYKPNEPTDRLRAWTLAGGGTKNANDKWDEPGAALRLEVNVVRMDSSPPTKIAEKVLRSPKLNSWGSDQLDAELLAVTLEPGKYQVTVTSLDEAPGYQGAPISVVIVRAYRGK